MRSVKQERRLAAILAAGIVNYSGLMEVDEAGTLAVIRALRLKLVEPQIADHRPRIVKLMGDSWAILASHAHFSMRHRAATRSPRA